MSPRHQHQKPPGEADLSEAIAWNIEHGEHVIKTGEATLFKDFESRKRGATSLADAFSFNFTHGGRCPVCNAESKQIVFFARREMPYPCETINKRISQLCDVCVAEREEKIKAEERAQQSQAAANQLRSLKERFIVACPKTFFAMPENGFPNKMIWNQLLAWDPHQGGILLYGPTGQFKTYMSWQLVKEYVRRGYDFEAYGQNFGRKTAAFAANAKEYDQFVDRLCRVPILFIDDLGKSRLSDRDGRGLKAEECLSEVIDYRYSQNLSIIVTLNAAPEELSAMISGDRAEQIIRKLRGIVKPNWRIAC